MMSRLTGIVVDLFHESEGKKRDFKDPFVQKQLNLLLESSKTVYASLVKYLAQQKNISISNAMKINWSTISVDLQQNYMPILEKKTLNEFGLEIGRCVDGWGARSLLQLTANHMLSSTSVNGYLDKVMFLSLYMIG